MPVKRPEMRKVKSGITGAPDAADWHARAKDYLFSGEVTRLLDAAKAGRHGARDHLLLLEALPWVFVFERGQPLTRQAVNYLVAAAAERAGRRGVHPHTVRHSCGCTLADRDHDLRLIEDYLGHRDLRHTVHYTRTAGRRFEGLWR